MPLMSSRVRESYSCPDVSFFGGQPSSRSDNNHRCSLPYLGKSPLYTDRTERSSAGSAFGMDTSRSSARGRAYPKASSRKQTESRRSRRSASRASSRASDKENARRESSWGGAANATRSRDWGNRNGWNANPRFHTRTQMSQTRAEQMMPHHTFDVDGDGVVSQEDFRMSSQFDINKDGVISLDERHELRKKMVDKLIKKYRRLPHCDDESSEELIKTFTKHIDTTVDEADFVQKYNELYRTTMTHQTHDSTNAFEALQPKTVDERQLIAGAFQAFDENGDGVISHNEFRTGMGTLVNLPSKEIEEIISIVDKDGDGEIDYLEFAKQISGPGNPKVKKLLAEVARSKTSKRNGAAAAKLDTFREGAKKFSGLRTREALIKSRKSYYKTFAAKQLEDNLTSIIPGLLDDTRLNSAVPQQIVH